MMTTLRTWWARFGFAVVCVAVIAFEGWAVFVSRDGAFAIHGRRPYRISEFAANVPVSHAFLMAGNGLSGVRVQAVSDAGVDARIRWTLYRGMRDEESMTVAFSGESTVTLRADHPQWLSFPLTRDGSSHDRWYTIEVQLIEAVAAKPGGEPPKVGIMATHDNPDRGGVLWVGEARKPGSLILRADWLATTTYRRFVTEGVPHLPAPLQHPATQALIFLAVHAALIIFARTLLRAAAEHRETGA